MKGQRRISETQSSYRREAAVIAQVFFPHNDLRLAYLSICRRSSLLVERELDPSDQRLQPERCVCTKEATGLLLELLSTPA